MSANPEDLHTTSDLQALVVGACIAAVGTLGLDAEFVFPHDDENGIHRPYFDVIGNRSGDHVRVMVVLV